MCVGTLLAAQEVCSAVPFVFLSATVPPHTQAGLCREYFGSREPFVVRSCTDRPSLQYKVVVVARRQQQQQVSSRWWEAGHELVDAVASCMRQAGSAILEGASRVLVYGRTHAAVEQLAAGISGRGVIAGYYHAGLSDEERLAAVEAWREGRTPVMCCTAAFSLGVDYSAVRLVVHAGLASSLVAYAQEVGRAGRDGQPALCVMCVEGGDGTGEWVSDAEVARRVGGSCSPQQLQDACIVRDWALDFSRCRRMRLQSYLDGPDVQVINSL